MCDKKSVQGTTKKQQEGIMKNHVGMGSFTRAAKIFIIGIFLISLFFILPVQGDLLEKSFTIDNISLSSFGCSTYFFTLPKGDILISLQTNVTEPFNYTGDPVCDDYAYNFQILTLDSLWVFNQNLNTPGYTYSFNGYINPLTSTDFSIFITTDDLTCIPPYHYDKGLLTIYYDILTPSIGITLIPENPNVNNIWAFLDNIKWELLGIALIIIAVTLSPFAGIITFALCIIDGSIFISNNEPIYGIFAYFVAILGILVFKFKGEK